MDASNTRYVGRRRHDRVWPIAAKQTVIKPGMSHRAHPDAEVAMGDVIVLRNTPVDLASDVGHQFITDCTRAGEGLITDKELAEKYELSPADWQSITKDVALGHAIRAERDRRVLNGAAAREAACKHFVKAPGILDQIMMDAHSNPRHKIEAIKELRQTAVGNSEDRPTETERFIIKIDLTAGGGGVETYNKPIKIDVSDEDGPNNLIPLEGKSDDNE
jgi:hypothetical protein